MNRTVELTFFHIYGVLGEILNSNLYSQVGFPSVVVLLGIKKSRLIFCFF